MKFCFKKIINMEEINAIQCMVRTKNVSPDAQRIRMTFCFKKTINMQEINAIYCMVSTKMSLVSSKKGGASAT